MTGKQIELAESTLLILFMLPAALTAPALLPLAGLRQRQRTV